MRLKSKTKSPAHAGPISSFYSLHFTLLCSGGRIPIRCPTSSGPHRDFSRSNWRWNGINLRQSFPMAVETESPRIHPGDLVRRRRTSGSYFTCGRLPFLVDRVKVELSSSPKQEAPLTRGPFLHFTFSLLPCLVAGEGSRLTSGFRPDGEAIGTQLGFGSYRCQ